MSELGRLALRVARFGDALDEAHEFGVPDGPIDTPWSLEFHRTAITVYRSALPSAYLRWVGGVFGDGGAMLDRSASSDPAVRIVAEYLTTSSQVMLEATADATVERYEMKDRTPSVMPFSVLASLVSTGGCRELRDAGYVVHERIASKRKCPLAECEIGWLSSLAAGVMVADLAASSGYSTRSMYRRLSGVWRCLGVETRAEGLAMAVREGWI